MEYMQESIVWIKDKNGRELACYIDDITGDFGLEADPDEMELSRYVDVSKLVGSKRW